MSAAETEKIQRTFVDGFLQGNYLELYKNGTIKIRGWVEKGRFEGTFYHHRFVKKNGGWEFETDGTTYRQGELLETMEFTAGKPHGTYEYLPKKDSLKQFSSSGKGNFYRKVVIKNGSIDKVIRMAIEAKSNLSSPRSSNSMSASQERTLRKLAEDLYDKCQLYGKSYDSRC